MKSQKNCIEEIVKGEANAGSPKIKKIIGTYSDDASKIKTLTKQLKEQNNNIKRKAVLSLGNTGKISALTPLCNIAIFDCDEGVRVIALTAILDIARKNSKKMKIAIKLAVHPLLTSLQKFPTPSYGRAVGWILSQLELSEKEIGAVLSVLQKKCSTLINSSSIKVLEDIIEMLKRR